MKITELQLETISSFHEPELQKEIEQVGILKTAKAGEILIDIGQYVKTIPILTKGSIKILRENIDGSELFMYYINVGDTCSMSLTCCMQNRLSGIRAEAEEDLEFIAIPVKYLEDWIRKYSSWRSFIFKSYQIRFDEMLLTIDSLAFKKMDERLMEYLKNKSKNAHNNLIHTTHQHIAKDLNASREAVSRLLKKMEIDGLIKLGRNKIEML
ncbi:MAG: CRP/FNR family transcriptional regulator [Planctomycetota bacterium]|jgi:CRP/FNR family transcriptional regulator